MSHKTIFIIGAGFSYDAGIPLQGDLLSYILKYKFPPALQRRKSLVVKFIKDVYGLSTSEMRKLALEDIYTPLHHSVSRNEYLKNYSPSDAKGVENNLNLLISHAINIGNEGDLYSTDYVNSFVHRLVDLKRNDRRSDPYSIVSLNWDILLDNRMFNRTFDQGVIDYACQYTGIDGGRFVPPMVAKERGMYTIKIMKLHGSLNWVTCPKCQRLFVNQREKEGMKAFEGKLTCRFCPDVKLNAALLLPSFKKDFDKFHFQSIWHQAGIELAEATKLVFMGYSFPLADYDFRSLITKHVGNVQVDVVLKSPNGEETDDGRRYRNYFGSKINRIHYDGVANYIQNHLKI